MIQQEGGAQIIQELNEHVESEENSYPSKGRSVYDSKGKGKKKVKVRTLNKSKRKIFMNFGGFRSEVKLGEQKKSIGLTSCYKYIER